MGSLAQILGGGGMGSSDTSMFPQDGQQTIGGTDTSVNGGLDSDNTSRQLSPQMLAIMSGIRNAQTQGVTAGMGGANPTNQLQSQGAPQMNPYGYSQQLAHQMQGATNISPMTNMSTSANPDLYASLVLNNIFKGM
jgi:hypothetical protein